MFPEDHRRARPACGAGPSAQELAPSCPRGAGQGSSVADGWRKMQRMIHQRGEYTFIKVLIGVVLLSVA